MVDVVEVFLTVVVVVVEVLAVVVVVCGLVSVISAERTKPLMLLYVTLYHAPSAETAETTKALSGGIKQLTLLLSDACE